MNALLPGAIDGLPAEPLIDSIIIGIDVGSTTVMTVVVDPLTPKTLFSPRHRAVSASTPKRAGG